VDAWRIERRRDDDHREGWSLWHPEETEGSAVRSLFATPEERRRLRIPLSPSPVLTIDAEPPAHMAEGSAVMPAFPIAPVAVEVRLRPPPPPGADQVDAVRTWLRAHRPARSERSPREPDTGSSRMTPSASRVPPPPPAPPSVEPLRPLIALEPARRGSLWPLLALSIGLVASAVATMLL
jgi:hypothetical protein